MDNEKHWRWWSDHSWPSNQNILRSLKIVFCIIKWKVGPHLYTSIVYPLEWKKTYLYISGLFRWIGWHESNISFFDMFIQLRPRALTIRFYPYCGDHLIKVHRRRRMITWGCVFEVKQALSFWIIWCICTNRCRICCEHLFSFVMFDYIMVSYTRLSWVWDIFWETLPIHRGS